MTNVSVLPPKKPDIAPRTRPNVTPTVTETTPINNENLAP